jgi:hypothetical protein
MIKRPCKVCRGHGTRKEIEEYIEAWPRYELYACYFCRGKGLVNDR